MFTTAVNGGYPRFPDRNRPQLLAIAFEKFEKGEIEEKDLNRARERAAVEVIAEQISAGIEVVNDGQVKYAGSHREWICRLSTLLDGLTLLSPENGNSAGDLKPYATSQIKWRRPLVLDEYKFLAERSPVTVRPALTGPYTIAASIESGVYEDDNAKMVIDIAQALNRELEGLQNAGAEYILIEEPEIIAHKDDKDLFLEAMEELGRGIRTPMMLATYGGDVIGLEDVLIQSPFEGFALDLVDGKNNEDLLLIKGVWADKLIQLGIIDCNDETIETPIEIAIELVKYAETLDPGKIWAAPARDLRNLNRSVVFKKLTSLSRGAEWARKEIARREEPGGRL